MGLFYELSVLFGMSSSMNFSKDLLEYEFVEEFTPSVSINEAGRSTN